MSGELASARDKWSRKRVLLVLLAGYLAARLLNVVALWLASGAQAPTGPPNDLGAPTSYYVHTEGPASPGVGGVLANWDGQWYERIASNGYPIGSEMRSANDAYVWQFPPLFPLLARLVMVMTGMGFPLAAVLLNLALGGVATALTYVLLRRAVSAPLSIAGAVSVSVFTTAPLFIVAYSEPAALVFILLTLRAIIGRRYALALTALVALAFTRPVAAPLALVFVAHWWSRWTSRSTLRPTWRVHVWLVVSTVIAVLSPFLWSATAALLMGDAQAITRTDGTTSGSARAASMMGSFHFGWFGKAYEAGGSAGAVVFTLLVALALGMPVAAAQRLRVPIELQTWGVAYTVFVLLVTPLTPSLLRYLLLASPLMVAVPMWVLGCLRRPFGGAAFAAIFVLGLWTQWLWIRHLYILDPAPALNPWAP